MTRPPNSPVSGDASIPDAAKASVGLGHLNRRPPQPHSDRPRAKIRQEVGSSQQSNP